MKNFLILLIFVLCAISLTAQKIQQLSLSNLPNQVNLNEGTTTTFIFNTSISSVIARNPSISTIQVNGTQVKITGLTAGRTGLKITSGGTSYMMGLRINNADGSIPGLPHYVSLGSVSEDKDTDLSFWKDLQPGLKNKQMDIRYIYINGGVSSFGTGWRTWGADRVGKYCTESLKNGLIPFFVYYNIPDGGESYDTDVQHSRNPDYMKGYFEDMEYFFKRASDIMQGDLYGMIMEPDFLGYIQQNAKIHGESPDPTIFKTAVTPDSIASNAGTLKTLVQKINQTINQKKVEGHHIIFGWMLNLWSYPQNQGTLGIIHRTDDLGLVNGRAVIQEAAEGTAQFSINAGILSYGADFVAVDKYGLDAMGYMPNNDPSKMYWFWNNDHWNNYLFYIKKIHEKTGKPMAIWQIPVGHINSTQTTSAYTNALFLDLDNTTNKYEDSAPTYFFGDTFITGDNLRQTHFSKNISSDTGMAVNGNTIRWRSHMQDCADAGIVMAMFGAGVGFSTLGIGSPPTDNYYFIQKVQSYYQNTAPISTRFTGQTYGCDEKCSPLVLHIKPSTTDTLYEIFVGQTIQLSANVFDLNGTITKVKTYVNSQEIANTVDSITYTAIWTPSKLGKFTITVEATDNDGNVTRSSRQFILQQIDPLSCKVPSWQANAYSSTTQVSFNGKIYQNKWTTSPTDIPGNSDAWQYIGICGDQNIIVNTCSNVWTAKVYPISSIVAYNNKIYKCVQQAQAADVPGTSMVWVYQNDCVAGSQIAVSGYVYFGEIAINNTQTTSFTVKNIGNAPLHISSVECPAGMSSTYSGILAAGDSATIIVSFTPFEAKVYEGLIKVHSDAVAGHYVRYAYGIGILATGIDEKHISTFSIYPNPANKQVTVNFGQDFPQQSSTCKILIITNIFGQIVYQNQLSNQYSEYKIDLRYLPDGIYIIRSGNVSKKLMISH